MKLTKMYHDNQKRHGDPDYCCDGQSSRGGDPGSQSQKVEGLDDDTFEAPFQGEPEL